MTSNKKPHKILLFVLEYGEFPEILRIANLIKLHTGYETYIQFAKTKYNRLVIDTKATIENGHKWLDSKGQLHSDIAKSNPEISKNKATSLQSLEKKQSGLKFFLVEWINFMRDFIVFRKRYKRIYNQIELFAPSLVIVGQDALGKSLSFALKACQKQTIPTIISPFAMFNIEELEYYAMGQMKHQLSYSLMNRMVAFFFPIWLKEIDGKKFLREPGSRALALELSRLYNGNPWIPCSQRADIIVCESAVAKRKFESLGLPPSRLRIVQSPILNKLAAINKIQQNEWLKRNGLDINKKTLLCGWPANITSWLGERKGVFDTYENLTKYWADLLFEIQQTYDLNVIASIHPKTLDVEIEELKKRKLHYVNAESEYAVKSCDLFTTLNGSSITAWAIACAKPVILFDCYLTKYPEFYDVEGCEIYDEAEAFSNRLKQLCENENLLKDLANRQARVANDWGDVSNSPKTPEIITLVEEMVNRS